jgi:replication initiation and membrane attachment protein DnaB
MKSEIQKLNESRTNTERVEQTMAILIAVCLISTVMTVTAFLVNLVKPLF